MSFRNISLYGVLSQSPSAPVSPLLTGLTHYYKFDSDANDSVGSSNGTVDGASLISSGLVNSCYSFDGSNDVITTNIDLSTFDSAFTINMWIKNEETAGSGNDHCFLGQSGNGGDYFYFYINKSGGYLVYTIAPSANVIYYTYDTTDWQMFTWTYDGSLTHELYMNATKISEQYFTVSIGSTGESLVFGRGRTGTPMWWLGRIDEPAIYSRVLAGSDITSLYNSGSGNQYPFA